MKAMLMDESGNEQGTSTAATPFVAAEEGEEMTVEALVGALGALLGGLGGDRGRVAAVGVAGMAESGAPIGEAGRSLAPVIAWYDPRGDEAVDRLNGHFGDSLAARIGQPLRTVSSVAKLGWLLERGLSGVRRWLGVPELCLLHLTGAEATEYSLAARTGYYDVVERRYMPEVAEALALSPEVFPSVLPAGGIMGRVSAQGAAWSGLPQAIPVTLAGHDHLAGAEGAGAGRDDLVNSVGTAETVMRRHHAPPDMARAFELRARLTVRPGGDEWTLLASAARAGVVLDAAARALGRSHAELDELTEGSVPVEVGDDVVAGLQEGEDPELPGGGPGEVWSGLLYALSRRTLDSAGRLIDLLGPARRLVVFGGGSRSRPWMLAKADVGDLPVLRTRAPETVVRGAAAFAGVSAGWWAAVEEAPAPPLEEVS
jgi:xylulokinase